MGAPVTPTLSDAQEAAQLLIDEGVSRVLLFGSLSRGVADDDSDIDLVALYDDLGDYSTRRRLESELKQLCEQVIGRDVDILVTDLPEWERRVVDVTASFEASIASGSMILADNPRDHQTILWDKEIGMSQSNISEALKVLYDCTDSLKHLVSTYAAGIATMFPDDVNIHDSQRSWRCSLVALVIENALKTLVHLSGAHPKRTHHIDTLLNDLGSADPKQRQSAASLLADLKKAKLPYHKNHHRDYSDIGVWRQAGAYSSDPEFGKFNADTAVLDVILSTLQSRALGIVTYTCAQLEQSLETRPVNTPPPTNEELDNLAGARQMIALASTTLKAEGALAADHTQYMSQHKLLSYIPAAPTATTDTLVEGVTADTPDASDTSKICGKRTKQDGSPCARLLKPDGQCPYHG